MGLGNSLQTAQAAAGGGGPGGWVELARTTLGSANADLTVSSLADKRYYMVLTATEGSSANSDMYSRFNGDSGSNYAYRVAYNGTESTQINQGNGGWHTTATGSTTPLFTVAYIANLAGKEKLFMCPLSVKALSGAGSAPERSLGFTKWTNTSDAINSITQTTTTSTTQSTGSEMVVLGWDPADTHTTNFWEELASVNESSGQLDSLAFTAKKYLWIQAWLKPATGTWNGEVRVGSTTIDTGTNYANRQSGNGGADATSTSVDKLFNSNGISSIDNFVNIFIVNNASNEKLAIGHGVEANTAGSAASPDRNEMVGKWANTSNQMDRISISKTSGSGVMDSTSILKVWGSD